MDEDEGPGPGRAGSMSTWWRQKLFSNSEHLLNAIGIQARYSGLATTTNRHHQSFPQLLPTGLPQQVSWRNTRRSFVNRFTVSFQQEEEGGCGGRALNLFKVSFLVGLCLCSIINGTFLMSAVLDRQREALTRTTPRNQMRHSFDYDNDVETEKRMTCEGRE